MSLFRFDRKALILVCLLLWSCGKSSTDTTTATDSKDSCGFTSAERVGVKICSFVATPTASESVTLINYGSSEVNLDTWTLWDANALTQGSGQKTFSSSEVIATGTKATYASLPFGINDSGETITLKDNTATIVSQKSN